MKNPGIIEALNDFSDEIADSICDAILSGSFELDSDDDWFVEELEQRVDMSIPLKTFFYLGFNIPENLQEINDETDDVTITVAVFEGDDVFSISADNSPLDGSAVGMHINVFFPNEWDLKNDPDRDIFMCELENTVRHELEHIVQEEFSEAVEYLDYHKIDFRGCPDPSNLCLYLVQPAEVSAHVRGYEKVSQTHFEFYKSIIGLLRGYVQKGFLTDDEELRVFLCWKDWFLRNTYIEDQGVELCAK